MKIKKILNIILLTILLVVISITVNSYIYATDIDTSKYKDIYNHNNSGLTNIGGQILWVAQAIGYAVSVITLIVIGITYVTKSPEQKAQVKDRLVTYAIGAAILFGSNALLSIVANFGNSIFK